MNGSIIIHQTVPILINCRILNMNGSLILQTEYHTLFNLQYFLMSEAE